MTSLVTHSQIDEAQFVQRAKELAPKLAARCQSADEQRILPPETIADLHQAGFFRLIQPKRWGGYEVHPNTWFDVCIEVAKGCPSTAWVLGVIGVHNWQMALFSEKAQEEVWGEDSTVLISSSYMPAGKVKPVEGGYEFSGRWGFSSGCDHCEWAFLGGFVPPSEEGQVPDMRTFLVPRKDYTIDDTWFVSGLKGTGSKDIVIDKCFVPEHRTHRMADGFRQKSPGQGVNPSPLFKLPFGQIFTRTVATPAIGMAAGALDAYCEVTSKRIGRADGVKVTQDPTSSEVAANAAMLLDEVRTLLRRDYDEMMACAEKGEPIPLKKRVRYRMNSASATDKCVQAVDELFATSGGGAIFLDNRLNQYWRDIHAARAHYANNPLKSARNYGGVMLGLKTTDFFL